MHSTNNLDDGYRGSGIQLSRSLKKHGADAHIREIIATAKDRNELVELEKQFVNEELLKDPLCMNLTLGGRGDFYHVPTEVRIAVCRKNGAKNGPVNSAAMHTPSARKKARATMQQRYGRGATNTVSPFRGKRHDDNSKTLISAARSSTVWMTNGFITRSVKIEKILELESQGFRRGRK